MPGKVLLTVIKNPFDPHGSRVIRTVDHVPGRTVRGYLAEFYPLLPSETDVRAARNGAVLADTSVLAMPGDSLVLCPVLRGSGGDSKNPLATVAMLAVVVAAAWAGPALAGYLGMTQTVAGVTSLTTAGKFVAGMTSMAVMAAGGLVVNAVFPTSAASYASAGDYADTSKTYSWAATSNPYEEGGAVPVLYGTMRVTPTIISTYTETTDDKQRLNTLYMVAEGELTSISGVQINGNAYTNYDGVQVATRMGALNQAVISFFGDSYSDISVYSHLATDLSWTTMTTAGDACDGLVAVLTCPSGLWHANDSGGLDTVSVTVEIQSRRKIDDTTWSGWESWGTTTISGSDYSTIRKTVRKDDLTQGKYEVRARFTATPPTGTKYGSDVYLDYVQEVYYDDFAYPYTALLGVRALATDQLEGGRPTVTCLASRASVVVNGVNKAASNPAWAAWDMLNNSRYGAGIPAAQLIESEFQAWADWCDEKNISIGLYIDATTTIPSALAMLSELGRGRIIQRGTSYGCIVDMPSDPVQMFTVGNIVAGSFEETWLDMEDRANVISMTYWDEDDDFARKTFEVRTDSFNSSNEDRERSVELVGCTDKRMAYRHGRYLLNCNKYLQRTISFQADVDAIACQPGDVILVQHDVPQWGYGGRVLGYDPETGRVTLDREMELPLSPGNYRLLVRHSADDSLEEMSVTDGETTTDRVTVSGSWSTTPAAGDLYSLGQVDMVTKPIRVVSISKSSDLICKITALEYYDEIYEDDGDLPQAASSSDLPGTANLRGTTTYRDLEGLTKAVLCLSWTGSALQWSVFRRLVGSSGWEFLGTTQSPRYDVFNLQNYRYYELCVSSTGSPTGGQSVVVNFPGDAAPAGLEIVTDSLGNSLTTTGGETIYTIGE